MLLGAVGMMMVLNPAWSRSLRVGGTGAVLELLNQLAPVFKTETGIALEVIPGLGTSGANGAVADGKLGVAIAGRELRQPEKAKGLQVVGTFRTPFGLVTSRPGPDGLKGADIAAVYRADRPAWPDGMPLLIILRPADESDNVILGDFFPGMTEALRQLRKRPDLSIGATDQDNAEMAEKIRGSLTSASLAQILTEKRNLRFVAIDGVMPSLETYLDGSYPYGKSLYLVVPSTPGPEAQAFVAFLATPPGRALLRGSGVIAGK